MLINDILFVKAVFSTVCDRPGITSQSVATKLKKNKVYVRRSLRMLINEGKIFRSWATVDGQFSCRYYAQKELVGESKAATIRAFLYSLSKSELMDCRAADIRRRFGVSRTQATLGIRAERKRREQMKQANN